ncbi:MAG TPA: asparagine synthase (glutamine-hydrolyzing) [Thermoleophilaceae bacterium]|nr:asparagine synthase (glutamine-hydrolyzing) [Thermoleophilaceae bacterium]
MCGISGAIDLRGSPIPDLERRLEVMSVLLQHRGPDDAGVWSHERGHVGFAHRRLNIIDPTPAGHQPMGDESGSWINYNGEVYNYIELRDELGAGRFRTACDTEVVLRAHRRWGTDSLDRLRGMFAYAIWDEQAQELVCARDRFGIKPFYYAQVGDVLYFASEAKALLPFLPSIETDLEGLKDYLAFQFCLAGKTLFKGVRELLPGHYLRVGRGSATPTRYWEVYYDVDFDHTDKYFEERVEALLAESVRLHLRSDVPVSTYLSGGLDSSTVASLASVHSDERMNAFTGKFSEDPRYDESRYARELAGWRDLELHEIDIGVGHFLDSIEQTVYHLDHPVAGPGSFPQYVVSRTAAEHCKVILGGQGGDETFGGYARYLIAYFEQCIKGAIEGTMHSGNFVVTYESIIPNLVALRGYKPLLQEFWREGLFEDLDARYFRLINRARDLDGEVRLKLLGDYSPFETFRQIFNGENVGHEAYFDKMTHFDFKTLLPALLQVEDRVSMAHGLESRVPLLDHRLVELAATIPADIKFKDGTMKHIYKRATRSLVPDAIADRTDKMGFPVPLQEWLRGPAREYVTDVFSSRESLGRELFDNRKVLEGLDSESRFGRKTWGLICLELWQRAFHDRGQHFKGLLEKGQVNEDSDHGRGRLYRLPSRRSAAG